MDNPTIYTVKVWFKDRRGGEHQNEFQFKSADIADEFKFKTLCALTKLRRSKTIGAHTVTVSPPLPSRYTTT